VVAPAGAVLARHSEECLLFELRQRARRSTGGLDVGSHAGMTASIRDEGKAGAQRIAFFADVADTP
jgi:hypothetical protein